MTSTANDSIRDEISDIRFSRRVIEAAAKHEGPLAKTSDGDVALEHEYMASCLERMRRLFKTRHTAKPNKYGYFD